MSIFIAVSGQKLLPQSHKVFSSVFLRMLPLAVVSLLLSAARSVRAFLRAVAFVSACAEVYALQIRFCIRNLVSLVPPPTTISNGASPVPNCTSSILPISRPVSNTTQPMRSLTLNSIPIQAALAGRVEPAIRSQSEPSASEMEWNSQPKLQNSKILLRPELLDPQLAPAVVLRESEQPQTGSEVGAGTSLCNSTATSPRRPCVLRTQAE